MTTKDGQNLFDIAIQSFGTLEQLFTLITDNNLSLNTKLKSGQELVINKEGIGDDNIKNFITLQNIVMNNDQGVRFPPLLGGDFNIDFNNDFN